MDKEKIETIDGDYITTNVASSLRPNTFEKIDALNRNHQDIAFYE